jgi:hypothetical protein
VDVAGQSARTSLSEAEARRAHRVLQAIWIIASAQHDDAVAADVKRLGAALKQAIEDCDWKAAHAATDECRRWLATMAGVVTARMTRVFD